MTNPQRGRPHANPRRRARALFIGTLIIFSVFVAQLFKVQAFDASATRDDAAKKRALGGPIPAMRGSILDHNGVVLASSVERFILIADPVALDTYARTKKTESDPNAHGAGKAAAAIAPLLGMPESEVRSLLAIDPARPNQRYVRVAKEVMPQTWRQIRELGVPGLSVERTPTRQYPLGFAAGSLVGFVLPADQSAGGGVEVMLDKTLAGSQGELRGEMAATGRLIPGTETVDHPAVDGLDVRLTIDADLQVYASNLLAQRVIDVGAQSGTVVVLEVATGKLRALASYPSFDPNDLTKAEKESLSNRGFQEAFEPGSTGKVMTMSAALETGVITPGTGVIVPNRLPRVGSPFKDNEDHPTEYLTAAGVLAKSSNIGTMLIGERVPKATMESYYRKFGVGAPTGVKFPGENPGILAPADRWNASQRYTVLYGQGYSVNAVQAASVFATIANGGVRMPVSLVEGTADASGTFTPAEPVQGVRVLATQTAATVSRMLENVTGEQGTARDARIPGYRVAGKTGTADRYDEVAKKYSGLTASFIGYAPADRPKYVVAVIIQRPTEGRFGGQLAGPVFNQVMTYLLHKDGLAPTGVEAPPMDVLAKKTLSEDDPSVLSDKQAKLAGL